MANKCRKSFRLSINNASKKPQNIRKKPLYLNSPTINKPPQRTCNSKNLRKRINKPDFYKEDDNISIQSDQDVFQFETDNESCSSDDIFMIKIKKNTKKPAKRRARRVQSSESSTSEEVKTTEDKLPAIETRKSGRIRKKHNFAILNSYGMDAVEEEQSKIFDSKVVLEEMNLNQNKNNLNVSDDSIPDISDEIHDDIPDNISDVPEEIPANTTESIDKVGLAKAEVENLTRSFLEDSGRVQIISNIVLRKAGETSPTEVPIRAKPWRWDIPCKKIYGFTYKDKSFTPRYEPNYNYKLLEKNTEKSKPQPKQTSIASFLKGEPLTVIKPTEELFSDIPRSPRKALSEINIIQSTPIKPSRMDISHDISAIMNSPKKISPQKENLQQNTPPKKPKKTSTKKPKIPSINLTENTSVEDITVPLFDELEEELVVSKSVNKYVKKYQKRKRPNIKEINDTDSDVDVETVDQPEPEKKKKNIRTKKEKLEAARLAKFYNSMFDEIQKYPLIIE